MGSWFCLLVTVELLPICTAAVASRATRNRMGGPSASRHITSSRPGLPSGMVASAPFSSSSSVDPSRPSDSTVACLVRT